MTPTNEAFLRSFIRFASVALGSTLAIAGLGFVPTNRLAGVDGIVPMSVGCAVSWVASCAAAAPLALARSQGQAQLASAVLLSTAIRFVVALVLVVPLALCGWFDRTVFVVWVAISYLLLLLVDTVFAVRMASGTKTTGS